MSQVNRFCPLVYGSKGCVTCSILLCPLLETSQRALPIRDPEESYSQDLFNLCAAQPFSNLSMGISFHIRTCVLR